MENYLKGTVLPIWEYGPTNFGANALLPLKTSPRCKVAARPRPGSSLQPVVRQRCCYAAVLLLPIRHSKDDNNGGINEIIGTVWMITLLPSPSSTSKCFPNTLLTKLAQEHPNSGLPGWRRACSRIICHPGSNK